MKKQFNHIIDGGTWGGFKASYILAEIINDSKDGHIRSQVGSIIHGYTRRLKALESLIEYREYFMKYVKKETKEMVKRKNFPYNIETHLLNIINAFYLEKIQKQSST